MNKIIYALNGKGQWTSIEDVPNGIECNCFCPYCNKPLIAKNGGNDRIHHFAHINKNLNCGYGNDVSKERPSTLQELYNKYYLPFFCHNGFKYFYIQQIPRNEFYALEATIKNNQLVKKLGGIIINKNEATRQIWQICGNATEKEEYKKYCKRKERKIRLNELFDCLTDDEQDKIIEDCEYFANKHVNKNQSQRRA